MFNAKNMKKKSIHQILRNIKESIDYAAGHGKYEVTVSMEDCVEWDLAAGVLRKKGFDVEKTSKGNMIIRW